MAVNGIRIRNIEIHDTMKKTKVKHGCSHRRNRFSINFRNIDILTFRSNNVSQKSKHHVELVLSMKVHENQIVFKFNESHIVKFVANCI